MSNDKNTKNIRKGITAILIAAILIASVSAVSATNSAPVANANGPYVGNEGSPILFAASGSYDADGSIVLYEWDFDSDGVYVDSISTLGTGIFTWGDEHTGIVTLRVTDNDGLSDTNTADVTVNNADPTADLGNDGPKDEGSAVTVSFSNQYDPGTADTFTYSFDWENDGT